MIPAPDVGLCAICASETPRRDLARVDLDGDGVWLAICSRCDTEHPRSGGYGWSGGRSTAPVAHHQRGRDRNRDGER